MLNWDELVNQAIAIRKEEGLSQRQVADLAGVTAPTIVKFEQRKTSIRVESALAILTALGLAERRVPPQSLVDELAALSLEGARMIRDGPVNDLNGILALEDYDRRWQMRVKNILRKGFPYAELVFFSRLGVTPIVSRDEVSDARYAKIISEYAVRKDRLQDIVQRYAIQDER